MSEPILKLEGLKKHFNTTTGGAFNKQKAVLKAVDGIDLEVAPGETIGLVGESGCGKSTTGRLITRLLEPTSGSIKFEGQEIAHLDNNDLNPIRTHLQMIFQDPFSSLNPRMRVAEILEEGMLALGIGRTSRERGERVDRRADVEDFLQVGGSERGDSRVAPGVEHDHAA